MPRTYKIVVIPGGGIGRDVKPETVKALKACEEAVPRLNFEFVEFEAGAMYYLKPERRNILPNFCQLVERATA